MEEFHQNDVLKCSPSGKTFENLTSGGRKVNSLYLLSKLMCESFFDSIIDAMYVNYAPYTHQTNQKVCECRKYKCKYHKNLHMNTKRHITLHNNIEMSSVFHLNLCHFFSFVLEPRIVIQKIIVYRFV